MPRALRLTVMVVAFLLVGRCPALAKSYLHVVAVKGILDQATANFVRTSFRDALSWEAGAILIDLDSPGGPKEAVDAILDEIYASSLPVIVRVTGPNGRALSSAVNIVTAADIAVMSPGAVIGNAQPLEVGRSRPGQNRYDAIVSPVLAQLRSSLESKGKNSGWVERSIFNGEIFDAQQALNQGIVDFITPDDNALFQDISGRTVTKASQENTINVEDGFFPHTKHWFYNVFHFFDLPDIAYLLLLIGMCGLLSYTFGPRYKPGAVIGGFSIMFAITSLQSLPVNFYGIFLMFIGVGILYFDARITARPWLMGVGLAILAVGSNWLFSSPISYFHVSWTMIGAGILGSASLFTFLSEKKIAAKKALKTSTKS